jgi:hypothetical protein
MSLPGNKTRWLAAVAGAALLGYLVGSRGPETPQPEPAKPQPHRQRNVAPPAAPLFSDPAPERPGPNPPRQGLTYQAPSYQAPTYRTEAQNEWRRDGGSNVPQRRPQTQFRPLDQRDSGRDRYSPPGSRPPPAAQWPDRQATHPTPQQRPQYNWQQMPDNRFRPPEGRDRQRATSAEPGYGPPTGYAPPSWPYDPRFPPPG